MAALPTVSSDVLGQAVCKPTNEYELVPMRRRRGCLVADDVDQGMPTFAQIALDASGHLGGRPINRPFSKSQPSKFGESRHNNNELKKLMRLSSAISITCKNRRGPKSPPLEYQ